MLNCIMNKSKKINCIGKEFIIFLHTCLCIFVILTVYNTCLYNYKVTYTHIHLYRHTCISYGAIIFLDFVGQLNYKLNPKDSMVCNDIHTSVLFLKHDLLSVV